MNFITERILIIEDNPSFSRAISHMLEKEGYHVLNASNGLAGLRQAKEENPDLVILDVMLPGLDSEPFPFTSQRSISPDTWAKNSRMFHSVISLESSGQPCPAAYHNKRFSIPL